MQITNSENRFYDSKIHDLIEQVGSVKRPSSDGVLSSILRVTATLLVGQDPAEKINREIECMDEKLGRLEQRAFEIEQEIGHQQEGAEYLICKQNLIATRQVLVELKLNIAHAILEQYLYQYGEMSEQYCKMQSLVASFQRDCREEGESVLTEDAAFWGIKELFNEFCAEKYHRSLANRVTAEQSSLAEFLWDHKGYDEEKSPLPLNTSSARESIIQELQLQPLTDIYATLSPIEKAHLRTCELKSRLEKIQVIFNERGCFSEADEYVTEDLRSRKVNYELDLCAANASLDQLKQAEKNRELESIRHRLNDKQTDPKEVLALQEQEKRVLTEIENLKQSISTRLSHTRRLEYKQRAQQNVDSLLKENMTTLGYMGKTLSRAIDVLTSGFSTKTDSLPARWQTTEWGKLIADRPDGMFTQFHQSIHHFKSDIRLLQANITEMEERTNLLETYLEKERFHLAENLQEIKSGFPVGEFARVKNLPEAEMELYLEEQVKKLKEVIRESQAALDDSKIALKAAFLERIIVEVGTRKNAVKEAISQLQKSKGELQEIRKQIEKNPSEKNYRMREKECLASIKKRQSTLQTLNVELEALQSAYQEQREKYANLPRGQHDFVTYLQNYFSNRVKEMMSFGAISAAYKPVTDFDSDFEFARFGYDWQTVLREEFVSMQYRDHASFFSEQMEGFLAMLKSHPDIAKSIAVDFALTLGALNNSSLLETLLAGLRAHAYTEKALGTLGRDAEARPSLTEEDYQKIAKYKAFADLVKWGPMAAALPRVGGKFVEEFTRNGIYIGVIEAAKETINSGANISIAKSVIESMETSQRDIGIAVLSAVVNGSSLSSIMEEQRNLAVLEIAGNAVRALQDRGAVTEGVRRFFTNQWRGFKEAGPFEKVARFTALVGVPVVSVAGALTALGAIPAGIVGAAVVTGAILLGVTGGAIAARALHTIPRVKKTSQRVQARAAEDLAERHAGELKIARDNYLQSMVKKRVLAKYRADPQVEKLRTDRAFTEIKVATQNSLTSQLRSKEKVLQRKSTPNEIGEFFLSTVGKALTRTADLEIYRQTEKMVRDRYPQLSNQQTEKLSWEAVDALTEELVLSWLHQELDAGFKEQFIQLVLTYKTPEQFENDIKNRKTGLTQQEKNIKKEVKRAAKEMAEGANLKGDQLNQFVKEAQELTGWGS